MKGFRSIATTLAIFFLLLSAVQPGIHGLVHSVSGTTCADHSHHDSDLPALRNEPSACPFAILQASLKGALTFTLPVASIAALPVAPAISKVARSPGAVELKPRAPRRLSCGPPVLV